MEKRRYNRKRMMFVAVILVVILFVAFEVAWLRFKGTSVPVPEIERSRAKGEGEPLRYVMMGDSAAVGQGGDYAKGIAVASLEDLAQTRRVEFLNTAVSGAQVQDVRSMQLGDALNFKPDLVTIVVGSNDVTHVTKLADLRRDIDVVIDELIAQDCDVKIVLTGSADMGAVPRIPQPLRFLAGVRAKQVNDLFKQVKEQRNLTFAPIADKTGPIFRSDRTLFAPDDFHPNTDGYQTWVPIISAANDEALSGQSSHCD